MQNANCHPVSNLLTVAKVLYDRDYALVIEENRSLKLQLFWKDFNLKRLKKAMAFANTDGTGPHCTCSACCRSGRVESDEEHAEGFQCTFKPWFEGLLESMGMTTMWSTHLNENHNHICLGDNQAAASVWDDDSHFAHFSSRDDWFWFTYGSKLWNAKSVDDPELQKLKRLFDVLLTESLNSDDD